jgi:hypothetical protein
VIRPILLQLRHIALWFCSIFWQTQKRRRGSLRSLSILQRNKKLAGKRRECRHIPIRQQLLTVFPESADHCAGERLGAVLM